MWKWHEKNPWGAVTLKKSLLFLLLRVWADLVLFYSFWIWSSSYECRVRQAIHSSDMLWPPYRFLVEKLHIIKVNVSLLDKPLYPKIVLWADPCQEFLPVRVWRAAAMCYPSGQQQAPQGNSDYPCIFQIPSFPLGFIEEKDPGKSLQQGHIRLVKPLKE